MHNDNTKEINEALAEANRQFAESKAILEHFVKAYSSAYTVNLKDDTFEILHMNHAFKQVFTMDGKRGDMENFIKNHVHPDDRESVSKMTDNRYIRERLKTEPEITFTIREQYDGQERTMHAIIMRGADCDHAVVGFMDVTDEMRKEKELNERLQAANRAKTSFLFNMSHDIRTPMNAIIGYTAMAKKYAENEKIKDYLEKIEKSSAQLLELVNMVLEMSRIESGKAALKNSDVNIKDHINTIDTVYGEQAKTKGIEFSVNAENITHNIVSIDIARLDQVINNIIGNAIKYTFEGGTVTYTVSEEACEEPECAIYQLSVKDTGIGISAEFVPHIFEEFARESTSTISRVQGTGLGMPIVKRLVDMLGGTINIESEKGKGTVVTVRLPLHFAKSESPAEKESASSAVSFEGVKVLLVEDNEMNREIAEDILSDMGLTVDSAEDGDIAVQKVKASIPGDYALVLMDVQMPRMNGYEATKHIRALQNKALAEIPIIAMTANAFEEDRREALASGMNEHLAKPVDAAKLAKLLNNFIK